MPAHTRVATVASFALHCVVLVSPLLLAALASEPPPLEAPAIEVARIELPRSDEAFAIDDPVPPEELSGYEMSGLPFNMAKIAARRQSLFPLLTANLDFLDHIPDPGARVRAPPRQSARGRRPRPCRR